MSIKKHTPEQREAIAIDYQNGLTTAELRERYDASNATINAIRNEFGLQPRRRHLRDIDPHKLVIELGPDTRAWLIELLKGVRQ